MTEDDENQKHVGGDHKRKYNLECVYHYLAINFRIAVASYHWVLIEACLLLHFRDIYMPACSGESQNSLSLLLVHNLHTSENQRVLTLEEKWRALDYACSCGTVHRKGRPSIAVTNGLGGTLSVGDQIFS